MVYAKSRKIVYLFGAGATHAELINLDPDLLLEKKGLLIGNVSSRVIELARRDPGYIKDVGLVSGTTGNSMNVELLIGLLENSRVSGWNLKTSHLKNLVADDIKTILSSTTMRKFYLHRALLEFHNHQRTKSRERLTALISLNYDNVLDSAYRSVLSHHPNYCFSLHEGRKTTQNIPLLKLHGSFNWVNQRINGKRRSVEIIPVGSSKSYLHTPYWFIWNRALDILTNCDVLRIVGCSLSPNDFHLIDLLFKAHLERSEAIEIQLIDFSDSGDKIRSTYGFFPIIKTLVEIEGSLIPERNPLNPFKTWLKYKSLAMLTGREIAKLPSLTRVAY